MISPDGTHAYTANYNSNNVSVIDLATNTITGTVPVASGPQDVSISPDGAHLYVTTASANAVAVIDTATSAVTTTIPVGTQPAGIRVNPADGTAYVTNTATDDVSVIDLTTNAVTATIGVGDTPYNVDVSPARPIVTGLSPSSGPAAGGNTVTITGSHLYSTSAVKFGGTPATNVTVVNATTVTATAPAHTPGTVHVTVTTQAGTSATGNADQYTYLPEPEADIDVDLTAQPHLGILVPYLSYTLTAHNTGPDAVTSATLTATLPPGATATNLPAGCTAAATTVTCTYGTIANGASTGKTFRVPLHLLSLGHVTVTGVRATSAPTDPNTANDTATKTCHVISIILATC